MGCPGVAGDMADVGGHGWAQADVEAGAVVGVDHAVVGGDVDGGSCWDAPGQLS